MKLFSDAHCSYGMPCSPRKTHNGLKLIRSVIKLSKLVPTLAMSHIVVESKVVSIRLSDDMSFKILSRQDITQSLNFGMLASP